MLTLTHTGDAVEDVASLTFTAIGAQHVDASVTATNVNAFTFIDICKHMQLINKDTHLGYKGLSYRLVFQWPYQHIVCLLR